VNFLVDYKKLLKSIFTFSEPEIIEKFHLEEDNNDKYPDRSDNEDKNENETGQKDNETGKKVKNEGLLLKNKVKQNNGALAKGSKKQERKPSEQVEDKGEGPDVSTDIEVNLEYMKKVYSVPINGDVVIREFEINVNNKAVEAFIIFFDGLTSRDVINYAILNPLMLLSSYNIKASEQDYSNGNVDVAEFVRRHLLPQNQLKITKKMSDVINEINFGGCGIFVDGIDVAFAADVKGWEHRGIDRPNTELVLRGPQEGFNEILRSNTALIRKILKDEDLIVEDVTIGKRSRTPCSILYIKDITSDALVNEVRRRLKGINIDYIWDSGILEQLIEDSTILPAPQIMATERPDRVASALVEGKVAVILHGSPFALIMPVNNFDLMKAAEDPYIRFPYSNFLRFARILGIILTLLLPGFYVAVTNYHHEMIPTDLLFALAASREKVPFPSVVEIIIMEVSFELIREAGIRIPGPVGSTLGIIGALILGQAAVAANIVSPILIIVVAVTGIGSFAVPNFSLGYAFRILRFAYIILGAIAGFLGITTGIFIHGLWLVRTTSFGVPFMAPFAPRTKGGVADQITRAPEWKQELRPDFLQPKDLRMQPKISRSWIRKKKIKDDTDES